MKRFLLVLAVAALHLVAYGQDFYSYYQGRRQFYQPTGNQLVVRLPAGDPSGRALASLRADARVLATSEANPQLGTVFLTYDTAQVRDAQAFAQEMRQALPGARSVSPVLALRGPKGARPACAWLDEVLVRPLPGKSQARLLVLTRELGLALDRPLAYDSATLVFRLHPAGQTNALEAANRLYESGLVVFAEPNWLMFIAPNNAIFCPTTLNWARPGTCATRAKTGGSPMLTSMLTRPGPLIQAVPPCALRCWAMGYSEITPTWPPISSMDLMC
jgi:hypothetical protein